MVLSTQILLYDVLLLDLVLSVGIDDFSLGLRIGGLGVRACHCLAMLRLDVFMIR